MSKAIFCCGDLKVEAVLNYDQPNLLDWLLIRRKQELPLIPFGM